MKIFFHKTYVEAGCDEAGRGCFAGPVFAAAVILPKNFRCPGLNDSKLLTAEQREHYKTIIQKKAIAYAVAMVSHEEIDSINILRASLKAMHMAIDQLAVIPELLLIDGNYFSPYPFIPHQCIIDGDATYASIAAAGILAKTYRDAYMQQLHLEYPQYNWFNNKGYGTPEHRKAIKLYGLSKYHRRSFNIFAAQMENTVSED